METGGFETDGCWALREILVLVVVVVEVVGGEVEAVAAVLLVARTVWVRELARVPQCVEAGGGGTVTICIVARNGLACIETRESVEHT